MNLRIVLCVNTFLPRVGGIENIADMMAHALAIGGDEVTVLTMHDGPSMPDRAYRLVRRPDPITIFRACRAADAVIMPNIGLKMVSPVIAASTPLFVWHQHEFWVSGLPDRQQTFPTRLKGWLIRHYVAANFGCSDFITEKLPSGRPKATLLNPYDVDMFYEEENASRNGDILGLGRLVEEKGFQIVLKAMALPDGPLRDARLSIVGEGPYERDLQDLAASLRIADRVNFLGAQRGHELRRTLNAHRVLAVPSLWDEPFGIVALEGLACGCATVVSNVGGLPQAIGGLGWAFERGNVVDAANVLAAARRGPRDPSPAARRAHLSSRGSDAVAREIRELMLPYLKRTPSGPEAGGPHIRAG